MLTMQHDRSPSPSNPILLGCTAPCHAAVRALTHESLQLGRFPPPHLILILRARHAPSQSFVTAGVVVLLNLSLFCIFAGNIRNCTDSHCYFRPSLGYILSFYPFLMTNLSNLIFLCMPFNFCWLMDRLCPGKDRSTDFYGNSTDILKSNSLTEGRKTPPHRQKCGPQSELVTVSHSLFIPNFVVNLPNLNEVHCSV